MCWVCRRSGVWMVRIVRSSWARVPWSSAWQSEVDGLLGSRNQQTDEVLEAHGQRCLLAQGFHGVCAVQAVVQVLRLIWTARRQASNAERRISDSHEALLGAVPNHNYGSLRYAVHHAVMPAPAASVQHWQLVSRTAPIVRQPTLSSSSCAVLSLLGAFPLSSLTGYVHATHLTRPNPRVICLVELAPGRLSCPVRLCAAMLYSP